ncbi:TetR/AcrR family transcriptional regulator [Williamsia sterculiae]|uniref:Transcriptional regulator, TetR family n=1 Tax=Williamsia sterculiae TaxID=1344003 RepID=A0A1N7FUY2_9NOCA|nr:TetR/AcrR family transcriptional regulator [Williamsia sterculiae]SIS04066.1 transcriptional regulator, TetR family [Williamsia sterculiae]
MTPTTGTSRDRILTAAAALLDEGGQAAITTRGVAERAGVQAPTIYRLFGDKEGLLDAIAEHVMAAFAAEKAAAVTADAPADPIEDLRRGWDMTIGFGVSNPALFALLADPTRGRDSPAAQEGIRLLAQRVHRVALAGRLRVGEGEAVEIIHAAGTGAISTIIARSEGNRDLRLADAMFAATLDQILTRADEPAGVTSDPDRSHAIALRARVENVTALSPGERALFAEWLDRIIGAEASQRTC